MSSNKSQPFIVWVGGKRKIIDKLMEYIPSSLNNYYEPFLGGGALFFNIKDKVKKAFLSDINLDLVTSYNAVKKTPDEVCKLLDMHEQNHSKEYFYQVRDVNNSNNPSVISARFLYLNRYSFRGIYRLNMDNELKTSCSARTYKNRLSGQIQESSTLLKDAAIYAGDFSFIEPQVNDFVYLDPPYHNSGESFYTRLPFGEPEQTRLKNFVDGLNSSGVKVMLSNSATDFITNLYKGYNIRVIDTSYSIDNYKNAKKEVIITNY
ncbi:MAG: Dam family site-specific DNA-(adenine-N6)-methyltransferase [Rickettsiaceae bacterium]|nr:Dam family site-specific DNA-(adenine-N6)-methyltransferase [Rickettsiaceae bacterium]